MTVKGTTTSADTIAAKYAEAAAAAHQLCALLNEIRTLVTKGETEPDEKLRQINAELGGATLTASSVNLQASTWESFARARARRY